MRVALGHSVSYGRLLVPDSVSYASSRARVDAAQDALSDRYCAVLESFQRNHHVLASDRVREYVCRLCLCVSLYRNGELSSGRR